MITRDLRRGRRGLEKNRRHKLAQVQTWLLMESFGLVKIYDQSGGPRASLTCYLFSFVSSLGSRVHRCCITSRVLDLCVLLLGQLSLLLCAQRPCLRWALIFLYLFYAASSLYSFHFVITYLSSDICTFLMKCRFSIAIPAVLRNFSL